jgi:hypothetical protein
VPDRDFDDVSRQLISSIGRRFTETRPAKPAAQKFEMPEYGGSIRVRPAAAFTLE